VLFIDFLLDDILLVNELAHLEEFTLVDGALTLISALRSVIVVNELAHLEEFTLVDGALTLISALRSVIVVNELAHLEEFTLVDGALTLISALRYSIPLNVFRSCFSSQTRVYELFSFPKLFIFLTTLFLKFRFLDKQLRQKACSYQAGKIH